MDGHDEDMDDIYQVPRSSVELDSPVKLPSSALEESPPPILMPKKGSAFKRTSSLLDRQIPNVSPQPPPRNVLPNTNSSVDVTLSGESKAECLTSVKIAQRCSANNCSGTPLHQCIEAFISDPIEKSGDKNIASASTKLLPVVSQQSALLSKSISDAGVTKVLHKNSLGVAADLPKQISNQAPIQRPVPVPRPRKNVPSPVLQNIAANSKSIDSKHIDKSSLSSLTGVQEQSSVLQSRPISKLPSVSVVKEDEKNLFAINCSIPPDADSIELMLNDEVDKKYGIHSKQNNAPELSEVVPENGHSNLNTQSDNSETDDDSNDYISPDILNKNKSLIEGNEQVHNSVALPKPHSAVQTPSYLQMNKSNKGSVLTDISSQDPSLLQKRYNLPESACKINIGTHLFGESSSDATVLEENSGKGFGVNSAPAITTPKPFDDIKPFISKVMQHSDAMDSVQETRPQSLDFSFFDPLWTDSTKPTHLSHGDPGERLNIPSLNVTNSDSNVHWNTFSDSFSKSSDTTSSTHAIPGVYDEPLESYYSQIERESNNTNIATAGPWKSFPNRESFHHDAPIAPPPPFPRQQNRIMEPVPPPVPPRPDNVPGTSQPPISSKTPCIATANASFSSTDIFQNLPTPAFMQNQSSDPFQDSNFDYECLKFNKTRDPALPSRSPLPKSAASKPGGSSTEFNSTFAAIDPRMDPERISRFVIPPPISLNNSLNADDYDLAREISSSDSDSTDTSGTDISMPGWSTCGLLVATSPRMFDMSPASRRNSRDGYLYKQGGYKANKGWKKRWVVFNGTSLSYYNTNTSQVSKRIIPVRCMVSTMTDIKETDKNSFKFKVITSLKDRVFIFSSESLEDCIKWASILCVAITEYKRAFSNGEELTPEKPDKEGFIKFSNLKKYYVTITGKTLCYYQSFEDYQMGSPIHEIDMKLCSVKVKDHKKLQLWIHYGHFDMTFDSDQEMQQWRMAMEDAIAEGLADDTVLNKVYENLSNHYCADCNAENPHWASINLGIVVCKNCAGVHRMFEYRISKIRSLRMDTRVWTPSLIEVMVTIGNANSNAFWESQLPVGTKIQSTEPMDKRKEFITKKYKNKKFCNLHPLANCAPALGEALLNAASVDNVLEIMTILFSGVDVLFRKEEHGRTAYEIAKENGQRLIMELLIQNGGDPQSLEQNVKDENRLREDIRLQGFLNKTGPIGRTFEKRWCILEHGALTYYLNEKSKTSKGSIDRKDMCMIQAVDADRLCYSFELSTGLKDNRVFTFSSESRNDCGEWMRTIAKLMAPVAVMDHVGMIDIKLAGYVYMKESLGEEWRQTFIVFSWRVINYMNRDLKFDYIDLRKASSLKMQDSSSGYQKRGQCFVISSTGKSVYLQATLPRDTEKMFTAFLEASTRSGPTLTDQALTNENVPVIVERCITHIHMNGLEEKGIYRTAGQHSKVQALLDEFRKDAWSVSLSEYTVQDVANVLKRFLRELEDSVFERINYGFWIKMAGCEENNNRVKWYKYYLEKMPLTNFQTLKRIVLHLLRVSQSEETNLMSIKNLAACFAPSLLRTANDEQPNSISEAAAKEIRIMIDLLNNADYFFSVNDKDRIINNNIQKAEIEIQKRNQDKSRPSIDTPSTGILTPVHLLSWEGQSINILVTENKTARDAMDDLKRNKTAPDLVIYILHEQLFRGALERPLFPEDMVATTTRRWTEWETWVFKDNNVCLCVQGPELLEKLQRNFDANHVLLSKQQYCDSKPSSKFRRKTVGFRQCKLALYNDQHGSSESISWNVEDLTVYLGTMHKKPLPPTRYCLTFTANGEKYTRPPFGHCISFDTEDELYRWASAMYSAQHPTGLLSWLNK